MQAWRAKNAGVNEDRIILQNARDRLQNIL